MTTGHWSSLAEAQKLTQNEKLAGIVETVVEQNGLLSMMPVRQLSGENLEYEREVSTNAQDGAEFLDQEEVLGWSSDVTYSEQTLATRIIARQDRIDRQKQSQYSNINDYRSQLIMEVSKRVSRFADHMMWYGDNDTNGKQFDGFHTLNRDGSSTVAAASIDDGDLNINMGEAALSLGALRVLLNNCKIEQKGRDQVAIFMSPVLATRFDAAYQEAGFVRASVTVSVGNYTFGSRDVGGRILEFDGVPIIRTDFLKAEQVNSGEDSSDSARTLYASGTKQYSLFVCRFGPIESGGIELVFGDPGAESSGPLQAGEFGGFGHESFTKLENYVAGGERVYSFMAPGLGALHSLGRIYDITNAALVA
jgi:hypothetical protein